MDLSAKNLHMFATDHWLSDPKNVLVLRLDEPAWVLDQPPPLSALSTMDAWGVEAVAAWLESNDMAGPAAYFRAQGVNGRDVLAFQSEQDIMRDLVTTPFVARKVFSLRGQHLAAQA